MPPLAVAGVLIVIVVVMIIAFVIIIMLMILVVVAIVMTVVVGMVVVVSMVVVVIVVIVMVVVVIMIVIVIMMMAIVVMIVVMTVFMVMIVMVVTVFVVMAVLVVMVCREAAAAGWCERCYRQRMRGAANLKGALQRPVRDVDFKHNAVGGQGHKRVTCTRHKGGAHEVRHGGVKGRAQLERRCGRRTGARLKPEQSAVDRKHKRIAARKVEGKCLNATIDGYRRERAQLRVDDRKARLSPVAEEDVGARVRDDGPNAVWTAARFWRRRGRVFDLHRVDVVDMPVDNEHTV